MKPKAANILAAVLQGWSSKMNSEENNKYISLLREEILADFSPITPVIYTSLDTAHAIIPECIEAIVSEREVDEKDLGRICAYLRPMLMRSIMQIYLKTFDITTSAVKEEDQKPLTGDWDRRILSNNGLTGTYEQRQYRLLKALKSNTLLNKIPPPGHSREKQKFYCNDHMYQPKMKLYENDNSDILKHNALYLWDDYYSDSISLYIACPRWGKGNKVTTYFIDLIEHPIRSIEKPISTDETMGELHIEKFAEDLDSILGPETDEVPEEEVLNESEQDDLRR
ncbi:hypothetical protein ACFLUP_03415 [Chloroflexota bacterium]